MFQRGYSSRSSFRSEETYPGFHICAYKKGSPLTGSIMGLYGDTTKKEPRAIALGIVFNKGNNAKYNTSVKCASSMITRQDFNKGSSHL